MARANHISRRRKSLIYQARLRVPVDLVDKVQRTELTKSLGTTDYREAKKLARVIVAGWEQEFEDMRNRRDLTETDLHAAMAEHYHDQLERDEIQRMGLPTTTEIEVVRLQLVEEAKGVRAEIVEDVRRFVMGLDISSFVVRGHLRSVETWQADDAPWTTLSDEAAEELTGLAALPSNADLGTEEAKHFDLVMFELQLSLMGRSTKMESCRRKVMEIATALSTKMEIPAIARHAELIEAILTEAWWEGLTVPIAERARLRLRDIVHLIDQASRSILYTDFEDDIGVATPIPLNPAADFAAFKKKAREFLSRHGDHVALRRLRSGKPLTKLDIDELERMLLEAGVGSDADLEIARNTESAQVEGFGVFLRSIVGLDRGAAQEYFAEFIADGASADQIEFVSMVIEHLTKNGVIDPGLLYDSPFTDLTPEGPDSVFLNDEVDRFLARLRTLNQTAEIIDPTAGVG